MTPEALLKQYEQGKRDFGNSDLPGVNFSDTTLSKVDFSNANLHQANLVRVNFYGANLSHANLTEANFYAANLKAANFAKANLQHADLQAANLQRASLAGANLANADLQGATLITTIFSTAEDGSANLTGATYNALTAFPPGFDPIAAGMLKTAASKLREPITPPTIIPPASHIEAASVAMPSPPKAETRSVSTPLDFSPPIPAIEPPLPQTAPPPVPADYRVEPIRPIQETRPDPTLPPPIPLDPSPVVPKKPTPVTTNNNIPWMRLILLCALWGILGWKLLEIKWPWMVPFGKFPYPQNQLSIWLSFGPMAVLFALNEANTNSSATPKVLSALMSIILGLLTFALPVAIPSLFLWAEIKQSGWTIIGFISALGASLLYLFLSLIFGSLYSTITSNGKIQSCFGSDRTFLILTGIAWLGLGMGWIIHHARA